MNRAQPSVRPVLERSPILISLAAPGFPEVSIRDANSSVKSKTSWLVRISLPPRMTAAGFCRKRPRILMGIERPNFELDEPEISADGSPNTVDGSGKTRKDSRLGSVLRLIGRLKIPGLQSSRWCWSKFEPSALQGQVMPVTVPPQDAPIGTFTSWTWLGLRGRMFGFEGPSGAGEFPVHPWNPRQGWIHRQEDPANFPPQF